MNDSSIPVLSVNNLSKSYLNGPETVPVWQDISFDVMPGQSVSIVGESGSGKTTLLNALAGLDVIDQGEVLLSQQALYQLTDTERTCLRNQQVGFVYQFHHLLPEFSAIENAAMPLLLGGCAKSEALSKAADLLSQLGLGARLNHRPGELSGGERQRTAIARSVIHQPKLVLLDEPTGNLDSAASAVVEELILELQQSLATAFVLVTHDSKLAERMDQQYHLRDRVLVPAE